MQSAPATLDGAVHIALQYCLGICSCRTILKQFCLKMSEFCFHQKFMALLSPLSPSFSVQTHRWQLTALPVCVFVGGLVLWVQGIFMFQFSRYRVGDRILDICFLVQKQRPVDRKLNVIYWALDDAAVHKLGTKQHACGSSLAFS